MNYKFLGNSLAALSAACIGIVACEPLPPLTTPDTFTMSKFDDEGNVTGAEEVKQVKFLDADSKEFTVSADVLNRGKLAFRTLCSSCHGKNGDGLGPSAAGLVPPPRNFAAPGQSLQFKFKSVPSGDLPTDDDLVRTVRAGLHGTAMLKWDVSETRLREIIQYIKTLNSRWGTEGPGKPIEMSPDPVAAKKLTREDAIKIGRWQFHSKARGNCAGCHPSYITQSEYTQLLKDNGKDSDTLRESASWPIPTESSYGVMITPPDFTFHELRSITKVDPSASADEQTKQHADRLTDLYRAIGTGIGGAAMPKWKDSLKEEELWGLVYFVDSLIDIKWDPNPQKRADFMKRLRSGN
ncbi:MAG: c-type cytochrome [Planctomycetes bacterium]|nr:c-type cytochrome [Planctomycetota bacterium]